MNCGIPRCSIDLHLHLDGSLSLQTAERLAALQGIPLPEEAELRRRLTVNEGCRSLEEYLEKFAFPCSLLQTGEALETAAAMLGGELAAEDCLYAEVRFAPQKHCEQGLTQDAVVEAVLKGMRRWPIPNGLILCCMRGADNRTENLETVELAAAYRSRGVCAVDLAGAEALFDVMRYEDIFARARKADTPITLHAGEADGPESVRRALRLGAARIGHGVRAAEDPALVRELAAAGIPLELCPTSNLNTAVFRSLADYPLPAFLEAGVPVTVNSDNRAVSDTTAGQELARLAETFGLTGETAFLLLRNAARAAFAGPTVRASLLKEIDAQEAQACGGGQPKA